MIAAQGDAPRGPRPYPPGHFSVEILAARSGAISVCVPARDEERQIGATVSELVGLRDRELIDEVVVVDGGSTDATAQRAAEAGASVLDHHDLLPALGPMHGKGDAMWRALSMLRGEIIVFLDADLATFHAGYVAALCGPLVEDASIEFVKSAFGRPFNAAGEISPNEGGRVTELLARPLLAITHPELRAFRQPLSGQIAGRRELLRSLPMLTGYAVDVALLIDAVAQVGLERIAEVQLGTIHNEHQTLAQLAPMAHEVALGVCMRLADAGRLLPAPPSNAHHMATAAALADNQVGNVLRRPAIETLRTQTPAAAPDSSRAPGSGSPLVDEPRDCSDVVYAEDVRAC